MNDEANRDDAKKALDVARRKLASSDVEGAIKFCKKSISLFSTPTAISLLRELEALQKEGHGRSRTPNGSAMNGSAEASTSTGSSHSNGAGRSTSKPSTSSASAEPAKKRDFTPEQAALVKRIRSCKITDYYEMMQLKKDCTDVEIKKSYRKLALSLHPDKNGAPGADEAFKLVSKAFQVLSDPQKRSIHDTHGADPDDRSAGMSSFSRGASSFGRGGGGQMFGEEVSAEELFNMFFGGGAGPAFAGGRGGMFGPGVRFQSFGGPQQFRRANQPGQAQAQQPAWIQLLPLIILVAFSILTQLPSLFTTQPPPDPSFSFHQNSFYDLQRQTHTHAKVDYFVNSRQYATHPFFTSLLSANSATLPFTPPNDDHKSADYINSVIEQAKSYETLPAGLSIPRDYLRFEQHIEQVYLQRLQHNCQSEIESRNLRLQRARGFFGLGADWDEVKKIEAEEMEACSRLRSLGYRIQT